MKKTRAVRDMNHESSWLVNRDPYYNPYIVGASPIWVFPKIGVGPQMDGLFHGKPYEQMDDLGIHLFLETPI